MSATGLSGALVPLWWPLDFPGKLICCAPRVNCIVACLLLCSSAVSPGHLGRECDRVGQIVVPAIFRRSCVFRNRTIHLEELSSGVSCRQYRRDLRFLLRSVTQGFSSGAFLLNGTSVSTSWDKQSNCLAWNKVLVTGDPAGWKRATLTAALPCGSEGIMAYQ